MIPTFPTNYSAIEERIHQIDAIRYAKTRNYLTGAITYLSPYIARGVISLPQVKEHILSHSKKFDAEKLLQELAWREYFQRVWQEKGDAIFSDLKQEQSSVQHHEMPLAIEQANTGIDGIDTSIRTLYETGYMHNHARMYTAMLACNIAQAYWHSPASWMYYHLLDGDLASNTLSWQWVAGSFSSKKYYANQENINKYTSTKQHGTYLDIPYESFDGLGIPQALAEHQPIVLKTVLPTSEEFTIPANENVYIYNSYNIDPSWHTNEPGLRILLIEPAIFNRFPVSEKVLSFMVALAKDNIPNIKILVANFSSLLTKITPEKIFYKEHPLTIHYKGNCESRDWMFPQVTGYYPSFFSFWKKAARYL